MSQIDTDFEALNLMRLYRVSDLLVNNREAIEKALFTKLNDLFSFPATVTLYDLTNTCFERETAGNAKARHGHSKEKRSDCPLVTLGLKSRTPIQKDASPSTTYGTGKS